MVALERLGERAWFLPGAVNVGVIVNDAQECLLLDSGAHADHAKKILRACEAAGFQPVAILNTHSHADHIGGNALLQQRLGLPAFCPSFETHMLQAPLLEPMSLFLGVNPPAELRNSFLMAQPSTAHTLEGHGLQRVAGFEVNLFGVAGHAHNMVAVLLDDVLFASDALFGPEVLGKYPLPFAVDVAQQMQSVQSLRGVPARVVLPGHGAPTKDVLALCDANAAALQRASDAVLQACDGAAMLPEIVARACNALGVSMTDLTRYVLNQTTVLAHLTAHVAAGRANLEVRENVLRWCRV